jgi:hypothetical protein
LALHLTLLNFMDDYLIVAETGIIIRILCGGILYLQADGPLVVNTDFSWH